MFELNTASATILLCLSVVCAATLSYVPTRDPFAMEDPFMSMKGDNDRISNDLPDRVAALGSFAFTTHVDVVMVCFSGDGNYAARIRPADLDRMFQAAVVEEHRVSVAHPPNNQARVLPISQKFLFHVKTARAGLCEVVTDAIRAQVRISTVSPAEVPVDSVDSLIRREYSERGQGATLYIMNPDAVQATVSVPVDKSTASRDDKMTLAYAYASTAPAVAAPGAPCLTSVWTGRLGQRYAWIDLTAGPLTYGPHGSGTGLITDSSLPFLDSFRSHRFIPNENSTGTGSLRESELTSAVSSLIIRSSFALLHPTLDFLPIPFRPRLRLHLVTVAVDSSSSGRSFDWQAMEERFSSFAFPGQNIEFSSFSTSVNDCSICAAAVALSMHSQTSLLSGSSQVFTLGLQIYTIALPTAIFTRQQTVTTPYIDSRAFFAFLEDSITRSRDLLTKLEFGLESLGVKGDSRVVPIILLQFSQERAVLIDNVHQALSQPVAVLAVQSPHGYLPSSLSCSGAVQSIDTRDATRPITAALLEAVWGAAGPHMIWNSGSQSMEEDHLWSVSPTPWATLHSGLRLPFHVKDSAQRAVVYNEVSAVIEALAPIQNLIHRVNVPLSNLLKQPQLLEFSQRVSVLSSKLEETAHQLSSLDIPAALFFARSAHHDVQALLKIGQAAGSVLHSQISCPQPESLEIIDWRVFFIGCMLASGFALCVYAVQLMTRQASIGKKK